MSKTTVSAVMRRDRGIVIAALMLITVLAWAYTLWVAPQMSMMASPVPASADDGSGGTTMPGMSMSGDMSDMPDMNMAGAGAAAEPAFRSWSIADFGFVFIMWAVMMVGMMTPSVTPMVLLYATVGRQAAASGRPLAPTGWFLAGYLSAWVAFSLAATTAQWALTRLALLTPMMASASGIFGGALLVAAGLCVLVQLSGLWNLEPVLRDWWTLFLILPAIASMIVAGPRVLNLMLLALGVSILLYYRGLVPNTALPLLPGLLLVYIGIRHIGGKSGRRHRHTND